MGLFRKKNQPVVPVVSLKGIIQSGGRSMLSGGSSLNIDSVKGALTKAFNMAGAVAVALDINSPGGSPTQSELIAQEIRRLSKEKNIPVIAFTQDLAASGGYWIACAADEIYAAKNSMIGSIGVVSSNYGATELFKKLGVEERIYTAGESKRRITMGKPVKPEDEQWLKGMLEGVHKLFKDWVLERRGDKLVIPAGQDKNTYLDKKVFTGDIWIGAEAVKVGLIDGVGYLESTLREKFGDAVKIVPVSEQRRGSLLRMFLGASGGSVEETAKVSAAAAVEAAADIMRQEAIWGPYNLR